MDIARFDRAEIADKEWCLNISLAKEDSMTIGTCHMEKNLYENVVTKKSAVNILLHLDSMAYFCQDRNVHW